MGSVWRRADVFHNNLPEEALGWLKSPQRFLGQMSLMITDDDNRMMFGCCLHAWREIMCLHMSTRLSDMAGWKTLPRCDHSQSA